MGQFVRFAYSSTPEPRMLTRFLILSCVTKWNFILVYKDNIREMSAFRRLSLNPLQRDRWCRGTANPLAGEKKHLVCRSAEFSWSGTGGGGPPSYILTQDELQDQLSLAPEDWDQLFQLLRARISSLGSWGLGSALRAPEDWVSRAPEDWVSLAPRGPLFRSLLRCQHYLSFSQASGRKHFCFGRILNCRWHHQESSYVYASQLCPRLLWGQIILYGKPNS